MVLVAALLTNTLSYCSAENVYCVTPTATPCSSCPHNNHCATLSEYTQEAELYFTSNTTIVFLPGDHVLDTNITVTNVDRLAMRGESSSGYRATIVCSGSVGINFTNIAEFKIDSLAFTSCNRKYAIVLPDISQTNVFQPDNLSLILHAVLLLHSTQSAELVNCSFHDNLGTALVVNNTNITLRGNKFIHNKYNLLEEFVCVSLCIAGSAVTAIHSNLIFTGNTTFLENSPVFLQNGTIIAYTTQGTISALDNTVVDFDGTSNFINNSALAGCGVIYASDNTVVNFN